jgi:hypothetical protein
MVESRVMLNRYPLTAFLTAPSFFDIEPVLAAGDVHAGDQALEVPFPRAEVASSVVPVDDNVACGVP